MPAQAHAQAIFNTTTNDDGRAPERRCEFEQSKHGNPLWRATRTQRAATACYDGEPRWGPRDEICPDRADTRPKTKTPRDGQTCELRNKDDRDIQPRRGTEAALISERHHQDRGVQKSCHVTSPSRPCAMVASALPPFLSLAHLQSYLDLTLAYVEPPGAPMAAGPKPFGKACLGDMKPPIMERRAAGGRRIRTPCLRGGEEGGYARTIPSVRAASRV